MKAPSGVEEELQRLDWVCDDAPLRGHDHVATCSARLLIDLIEPVSDLEMKEIDPEPAHRPQPTPHELFLAEQTHVGLTDPSINARVGHQATWRVGQSVV